MRTVKKRGGNFEGHKKWLRIGLRREREEKSERLEEKKNRME
jgi:hypothetical protein